MEQKIELLKKIKALAVQGYKGEQDNAINLYNKLKAKYNIQDQKPDKNNYGFAPINFGF